MTVSKVFFSRFTTVVEKEAYLCSKVLYSHSPMFSRACVPHFNILLLCLGQDPTLGFIRPLEHRNDTSERHENPLMDGYCDKSCIFCPEIVQDQATMVNLNIFTPNITWYTDRPFPFLSSIHTEECVIVLCHFFSFTRKGRPLSTNYFQIVCLFKSTKQL